MLAPTPERTGGSGPLPFPRSTGTPFAMSWGMTQLLTERDASQLLCLSVRTLQKWRLSGRGPRFLKLGHAVRYDRAELERFLTGARRASTSDPGAASGESRKHGAR